VPGAGLILSGILVQRAVVPLGNQRPQNRLTGRIDPRRGAAGVRLGAAPPLLSRLLAPEIDRRQTNLEALGHGRRPQTALVRLQNPLA
jgi:hypothetical protein